MDVRPRILPSSACGCVRVASTAAPRLGHFGASQPRAPPPRGGTHGSTEAGRVSALTSVPVGAGRRRALLASQAVWVCVVRLLNLQLRQSGLALAAAARVFVSRKH